MKKKTVKAIDGKDYPIDECVQIKGDYYVISDPTKENDAKHICFLVGKKYYRLSAGSILYDHRLKKYVLRTEITVERGVVGFDKDYNPIFGGFSYPIDYPESDKILINYMKKQFLCLNIDIIQPLIDKDIWQERLSSGVFFKRTDLPINEFNKINRIDQSYKKSLDYNSGKLIKDASKYFDKHYNPKEYNKGLESFPKIAKDYTFGLEFETIKGDIPSRISKPLGLIPLRDGSIDGLEFVTIPHSGKKGVQAIIDSLVQLQKRTTYDKNCSLHIHIGGMPRTESFFCALTRVLSMLQEEVYNQFPYCTKGGLKLKNKDFTAPLPVAELLSELPNNITSDNVKDAFDPIFKFLSMGHPYSDFGKDLENVKEHPSDPRGDSKWYVKSRYRWVNMIPLLFGNKETIEFRIHTPTYNPDKVINFLVLCLAIIDFAKVNETGINDGSVKPRQYNTIDNILVAYLTQFGDKYETLYFKMQRYWSKRKSYQKIALKAGDFYACEDNFTNFSKFYTTSEDDTKDILTKSIKKIMYDTPSLNEMETFGFDLSEEVQEVISYNSRNLRRVNQNPHNPTRLVRDSEGRLVEQHGGSQRVRRG